MKAKDWLLENGYPEFMNMTRDNLEIILNRFAALKVETERGRIKMYMKGRLDKCESEIKDTSVDSDARRILQGHKYELSHLLKEIDSL